MVLGLVKEAIASCQIEGIEVDEIKVWAWYWGVDYETMKQVFEDLKGE